MGSPNDEIETIAPGRSVVHPGAGAAAIATAAAAGGVLQFDRPLPSRTFTNLRDALVANPKTELYVYGHYGDPIDATLEQIGGLTHLESLSVNLAHLADLDWITGLSRLRRLVIGPSAKTLDIAPLGLLENLAELSLGSPVNSETTLSHLPSLRSLAASGNQRLVSALADNQTIERLVLHFGTAKSLEPLETMPRLRDLEIWNISKLDSDRLQPVGRIPAIEALALGAIRNVTTLKPLTAAADSLRFLGLEKAVSLETLEPLAELKHVLGLAFFEARPADRKLTPLHELSELRDLGIHDGGYAKSEVQRLIQALPRTRMTFAGKTTPANSRIRWRGLFRYVDEVRKNGSSQD